MQATPLAPSRQDDGSIDYRMGFDEMTAAHAVMDGGGSWGSLVVDVAEES